MTFLPELFLLAALASPVDADPAIAPVAATAPQQSGGNWWGWWRNRYPGRGTPEPATLLLVAGSVVGYGVMRLRRRKDGAPKEN